MVYFADFAHMRRHGRPITGADYQKLANGPAARRLLPVYKRLIDDGEATLDTDDVLGYQQQRLRPLRDPDLSRFSDDEMATIDDVLGTLTGLTARQVCDLSHEEAGWRSVEIGETIPYFMAMIPKDQPLTPTARRQALAVAERYGVSVET